VRRLPALCVSALLVALAALGVGCGEGGVGSGATASVYVAASLCDEAQRELRKAGGEVEDLKVRVICLSPTESKERLDLAIAGANARRATEDSTAVAYLEAPGPAARFTRPIVEAANIAWIETTSSASATHRVLKALSKRGSSSPRDKVRESLSNG
jgi:hypothetical protein